jgi:Ni,Fe-hydrogenase I cytochrome b subunit
MFFVFLFTAVFMVFTGFAMYGRAPGELMGQHAVCG